MGDKLLFTPGPLTTSDTVKQAALRDLGSRDHEFIETVRDIRVRLLELAGVTAHTHTAIPMQGSGTFGVEAMLTTAIPRDGKLLVLVNGAYGHRMMQMAAAQGIAATSIVSPENLPVDPTTLDLALAADPDVTHVAVVHCETTTGVLNDVAAIAEVASRRGRGLLVDAMSSFGAVPMDLSEVPADFLVSSANKCIEGIPGFSFAIARLAALEKTAGNARALSLDLHAQWAGLEKNGQFRFTPPTHALLAFRQALVELEAEGGVAGRRARYAKNHAVLIEGMDALGFERYLDDAHQSVVITSFRYPDDPRFDFTALYERLSDRGFVIYPGKVSDADCFRIGTIGHVAPDDVRALLGHLAAVLNEMGVVVRR